MEEQVKGPGEYAEEQNRLKSHILGNMKQFKKSPPTPAEQLMLKAQDITTEIRALIKPILQAGGWKDPGALRSTICTFYLEAFHKLDKEELENLCAILHMEIFMETIKQSPWGNDKPDLLAP